MNRDPVKSSSIISVGYDSESQILEIELGRGTIYQYHRVPQEEYDSFMTAPSLGRYFVARIRDAYPTVKIS